jgi:hypothetical protein
MAHLLFVLEERANDYLFLGWIGALQNPVPLACPINEKAPISWDTFSLAEAWATSYSPLEYFPITNLRYSLF